MYVCIYKDKRILIAGGVRVFFYAFQDFLLPVFLLLWVYDYYYCSCLPTVPL